MVAARLRSDRSYKLKSVCAPAVLVSHQGQESSHIDVTGDMPGAPNVPQDPQRRAPLCNICAVVVEMFPPHYPSGCSELEGHPTYNSGVRAWTLAWASRNLKPSPSTGAGPGFSGAAESRQVAVCAGARSVPHALFSFARTPM